MSNTIKYSEGSESLALNKGNWWIGTGDSNKGPTVESGYWNAINPPDGGYTVYLNKESNGPSIHSITSDENLISFTNKISGNNYTTVAECLVYYQTQDDKLCVNREIENIVTDGLVLNLDAGYVPSYPTSGTTWYDLSGNGNNGSLVNGVLFNSDGYLDFDGTDDYLSLGSGASSLVQGKTALTMGILFKMDSLADLRGLIGTLNYNCSRNLGLVASTDTLRFYNDTNSCWNIAIPNSIQIGEWLFAVGTYDGTTTRLYGIKDNNMDQVSGTTKSGATNTFNSDFRVMGNQYSQYFTNGQCAQAFVYDRVLSESEILQNYNAIKGRFGL